jgi:hydrogenase-4 component F
MTSLLAPAIILMPVLAGLAALAAPSGAVAAWCAIAGATGAFLLAAALPWFADGGWGFLADPLSSYMTILVAFVAMTGAWLARPFWRLEVVAGRVDWRTAQRGHAIYPALLAGLLLMLLADQLLLVWSGMAAVVLFLIVALRLTGSEAAARRLFLVGGAALGVALLGLFLFALAALPAVAPGTDALQWTVMAEFASRCDGWLLTLGSLFLLLGFSTVAGLVPLHGPLLEAEAAGPVPLTGLLGGMLPAVALIALLRARSVVASNPEALTPGPAMVVLGLLSLLLAAATLRRQPGGRQFLAVAGLGQIGIVAFAFGLDSGAATFAGLLHLTLLILTRAALIQTFGRAEQMRGGGDLAGLLGGHPALALTLVAGLIALAGLPPFGLFTSLFLVVMETVREAPALAIAVVLGVAASAWALGARMVPMSRHTPPPDASPGPPPGALLPAWLHLAVVAVLGLAMPQPVVEWLAGIAQALR